MNRPNVDKVLAVIPARYGSTRFPGKMIVPVAGKPLVVHTFERACQASLVDDVVVATDDNRVAEALAPFGVPVVMTSAEHPSGTDRIAEVASGASAGIIVNVQGDEPLIDPATIDATVEAVLRDKEVSMATARRRITRAEEITDSNVVKVVCDGRGRALYCSRHPIPFVRDAQGQAETMGVHWQHIGLYVFRRGFLLAFAKWAPTPLEMIERLEQLRALENGHAIAVVETTYESIGVDAPDDLKRVAALLEAGKKE
ncbi:MAG: 3-deoxy-manno-octulosonate cytidylyltransferase [Candidatus Hydrogenedentes bacterium]|nr:3-deoxy-manno-octulosonate cytidylyltransferase [Candidatus Hydrogenedentota bacterium]